MIKNVKLKVVGVTFANEDGTEIQFILSKLKKGDNIILRREPHNKYDVNAIAVWSDIGQVGYIAKDYSSIIAPMMDNGTEFRVDIAELDMYKDNYYLHITINEVDKSNAKDSTELSGGHLW